MLHFSRFKMVAILLTCLVSILFALPNLFTKEKLASWPRFLPTKQMPLGLDLQGGAHLLLRSEGRLRRRARRLAAREFRGSGTRCSIFRASRWSRFCSPAW